MHEGGGRWVGSNKLVELKKKKRVEEKLSDSYVWFMKTTDTFKRGPEGSNGECMDIGRSILDWVYQFGRYSNMYFALKTQFYLFSF